MYGLRNKIQDLSRIFSIEKMRDLLFPKFCAGCKKEGDWVCEKCLPAAFAGAAEPDLSAGEADGCAAVGEAGCLDGITALFNYGENTPSKLIKMFKYDYVLEIRDIFEKIIYNTNFNSTWPGFTIIPVPLHARRQRERGFNQAEIFADLFAKKLGLKVDKKLSRPVYTMQQAKLSGEKRRANLKNAFIFNVDGLTVPEKVLLVDDVFTTGTTMQECAKVLKNNGVKVVWGLVLARG